MSQERIPPTICHSSSRLDSFLGHLVLSIDGMMSRIWQRMISISKYSPLVKFKIHGQKRTRADIIIQPSSPLIPPPQPLAHFRRSFKRTFRRTFKRTFIIFFWIQRSQSPNNPSYQGLKFPSSNNPMLWSSKALKPFYSSQNPLNLSFTLKQLLLAFIWKYHSVDFETIWMWGWVLSYVCILLMEFVSMFYL